MINTALHIKIADNADDLDICNKLREIVLVEELGMPNDGKDDISIHFLLFENGISIGTARIFPDNQTAVLGRCCILKEHRRKGAGKFLIEEVIDYCKKKNFEKIAFGAHEQAIPFYSKLGFNICNEKIYGRKYAACDMQLILK